MRGAQRAGGMVLVCEWGFVDGWRVGGGSGEGDGERERGSEVEGSVVEEGVGAIAVVGGVVGGDIVVVEVVEGCWSREEVGVVDEGVVG